MLSYVTTGPGEPLVEKHSELPAPAGGEVLLRTVTTGVCHSDLHLQDAAFDLGGGKRLEAGGPGMVLGHEIAGEVVALGQAARGVSPGDLRVVYPWIGCGHCQLCAAGLEQLCNDGRVIGIQKPGGFADHVLVPDSRYLFDAGTVEPGLACTYACSGLTAYSALKKSAPFQQGERIVIVGAGGVGFSALLLARAVFGVEVVVVDIDESRLAAATDAGALQAINPLDDGADKQVREATGGGARVAIDFVGSEQSSRFAGKALHKAGTLVIVGLYGGTFSMPLPLIPMMERRIQGSYVGSLQEMAELMALVRAGKVPPGRIDKRSATAENATGALSDLRAGRVSGRAVIVFPDC